MAKKRQIPLQTSLYDETPGEEALKNMVVIYEPDGLHYAEVLKELMYSNTKDELYQQATVFHPMLKNKTLVLERADGSRTAATDMAALFSSGNPKEKIARAMAYILADQRNLKHYIDTQDEGVRQLWRHLLYFYYASEKDMMNLLGSSEPLISKPRSRYYDSPSWNRKGFEFFTICSSLAAEKARWNYREHDYFIRLSEQAQRLFFPLLCPEAYTDITVRELPEDGFSIANHEEECVAKYQLLSSMIQTGRVGMTARGLSQADVRRTAQQLGMSETYVSLPTLVYPKSLHTRKTGSWQDMASSVIAHLGDLRLQLPALLLPHIKGLRKGMISNNRLPELCLFVVSWLKQEPERWSPIQGIFTKTYAANAGTDHLRRTMLVVAPNEQDSSVEIVNEYSGRKLAVNDFVKEFGYTALQSFAYMLCNLGLVELAVAQKKSNFSPFADAQYIRLTPLGRYVLRISDEYEPPVQEQTAYFELDPERLIIRSLVNPNPYAQLLLDTSVAISRNRFETSAKSFLAHCTNRSDVEHKIGIFKQFVSSELPELWRQFFDNLLQHCNPLKNDRTGYHIYQLSPENTDLIRLLTTDATLRKLTIRAEGYLILVKKGDDKLFTDELKKHGYLV